ncbi:hypothetical protein OG196_40630 [Kitasatospora purpeofusca]|uniref:hypothetical protein n=1 Tax=Kitasatospora purpeofusca TaxID=67352 RepID=UPI002E1103AE|nr:hypothetical protein OG196_40630 [Kitasatospora purpeofusca]
MHHRLRRSVPALTALGLTAGAAVLASPAAQAAPDCGHAPVQYSVDGGTHWTNSAAMPAPAATVQVRLAGEPTAGCDYHVSLASYATQGATWATSGLHTQLGRATTTLNRAHYRDTLDISGHLPPCFGELALYNGEGSYDGSDSDNPLPRYPGEPYSGLAIATWNGGAACTSPTPTATPTPTPTPTPTLTPTATPTPTPTPTSTPTTATPTPTTPAPAAPTTTPTTPAPALPAVTTSPTAAPTASASATASPKATATAAPALAATGADDGTLTTLAIGAAALATTGGAVLYTTRRRTTRN